MAEREPVCYIDTVDSDAHYLVKGTSADVAKKLERSGFREFVAFDLSKGTRQVRVCAAHVIAVLDPVS